MILLKIKGIIQGRVVNIAICPSYKMNYINVDMANQLLILETNIKETLQFKNKKQYEINDLLLRVNDYTFLSKFNVISIL